MWSHLGFLRLLRLGFASAFGHLCPAKFGDPYAKVPPSSAFEGGLARDSTLPGVPRLFFELCPCFVAGMWLSEHLRSGASFCVTRARMDKFLFAWQAWRLLRVAKTRGLGRNERCAFGRHFCVLPQPSRPFVPDRSRRGLVLIFMVSDSSLCGAVLILRLLAQPSQHLLPGAFEISLSLSLSLHFGPLRSLLFLPFAHFNNQGNLVPREF